MVLLLACPQRVSFPIQWTSYLLTVNKISDLVRQSAVAHRNYPKYPATIVAHGKYPENFGHFLVRQTLSYTVIALNTLDSGRIP